MQSIRTLWYALKVKHAEKARTILGITLICFVIVSVMLDPKSAADGSRIGALITGTGLIFGSDATNPDSKPEEQ